MAAWGMVTGSRPKSNFTKLEPNVKVTIRPLEDEPYSVFEHVINATVLDETLYENMVKDGIDPAQAKTQALSNIFRTCVCPRNPREGIDCPMCQKNREHKAAGLQTRPPFQLKCTNYLNIWNYTTGQHEVMQGGNRMFEQFHGIYTLNNNRLNDINIMVMRTGSGRDTRYIAQNIGKESQPPAEAMAALVRHDLTKFPRILEPADLQKVSEDPAYISVLDKLRKAATLDSGSAPPKALPASEKPTPKIAEKMDKPKKTKETSPAVKSAGPHAAVAKLTMYSGMGFAGVEIAELRSLLSEVVMQAKLVAWEDFAAIVIEHTATDDQPTGSFIIGEYDDDTLKAVVGGVVAKLSGK